MEINKEAINSIAHNVLWVCVGSASEVAVTHNSGSFKSDHDTPIDLLNGWVISRFATASKNRQSVSDCVLFLVKHDKRTRCQLINWLCGHSHVLFRG